MPASTLDLIVATLALCDDGQTPATNAEESGSTTPADGATHG